MGHFHVEISMLQPSHPQAPEDRVARQAFRSVCPWKPLWQFSLACVAPAYCRDRSLGRSRHDVTPPSSYPLLIRPCRHLAQLHQHSVDHHSSADEISSLEIRIRIVVSDRLGLSSHFLKLGNPRHCWRNMEVQITQSSTHPPFLSLSRIFSAFSSKKTNERGGMVWVRKTLAPRVEPAPTTVSPPITVAPA